MDPVVPGQAAPTAPAGLPAALAPGQILSARVVQALAADTYLVAVRGMTLVAASETPLATDSVVRLVVQSAGGDGPLRVALAPADAAAPAAAADGPTDDPRVVAARLGLPPGPLTEQVVAAFQRQAAPLDPPTLRQAVRLVAAAMAQQRSAVDAAVFLSDGDEGSDDGAEAPLPTERAPAAAPAPAASSQPARASVASPPPAPAGSASLAGRAAGAPASDPVRPPPAPGLPPAAGRDVGPTLPDAKPAAASSAQTSAAPPVPSTEPAGVAAAPGARADAARSPTSPGPGLIPVAPSNAGTAGTVRTDGASGTSFPAAEDAAPATTAAARDRDGVPAAAGPRTPRADGAGPSDAGRSTSAAASKAAPITVPGSPLTVPQIAGEESLDAAKPLPPATGSALRTTPATQSTSAASAARLSSDNAPTTATAKPAQREAAEVRVPATRFQRTWASSADAAPPLAPATVRAAARLPQGVAVEAVARLASSPLPVVPATIPVAVRSLSAELPRIAAMLPEEGGSTTGLPSRSTVDLAVAGPASAIQAALRMVGIKPASIPATATATATATADAIGDTVLLHRLVRLAAQLGVRSAAAEGTAPEAAPPALRGSPAAAPTAPAGHLPLLPDAGADPTRSDAPATAATVAEAARSADTALTAVHEAAAQDLLPPKELADYDRVLALPLAVQGQPVPARLAVTSRRTPTGGLACWMRVDCELSRLGPVSIRLGAVDAGPVAITLFATPKAGPALVDALPGLGEDLRAMGVDAALRVVEEQP